MNRLLFLLFLLPSIAFSQLSDGDTAPNFTLTDTDGNSHTLYSYLNNGYSVILDFSATWCGPCWSYHTGGPLEDLWDDYGPDGEDMLMVFMVEADPSTAQDCIYGRTNCSRGSIGDWTTKDYPVLNPPASQASRINNDYDIPYWPTLYGISPNKEVYEIGRGSYNTWEEWVIESFQLHNSTYETTEVKCGGDGAIDLEPGPSTGNLSYEWSNRAATQDISGLDIDDYDVTITNNDTGYEVIFDNIEIDGYEELEMDLDYIEDVSCPDGEDGLLEIEIDGGSGDFDIEWDNGENGLVIENLPARRYYVTITDNVTECEIYDDFKIDEPRDIEIDFDTGIAPCGEDTGWIELFVQGGTDPYVYEIEGKEYDENIIELEPRDYEVYVIDRNGCTAMEYFTIDEESIPESRANVTGQITCNNPIITIDGAGSETGSNISYQWEDEDGNIVATSIATEVSVGGEYTLFVTDDNTGCSSSASVDVDENTTLPNATASLSNNLDCNNSMATLSSTGSSTGSNFTYTWSTQNGTINSVNNGATATVTSAGTYTLEVTNISSGCSSSTSVTIVNTNPQINLSGNTQFCNNNATELCLSPSASQTIEWIVNGVVVSRDNCISLDSSEIVTINMVESNNGCSASETFDIIELEAPTIATNGDTGFCSGSTGEICLDIDRSYTYVWIKDGQILPFVQCIELREAGELELYATDTLTNCTHIETYTIQQYDLPTASIATPQDINCANNSALLDLTTESGSSVSWYDENGNLISNNEDTSVGQAGNYTAIITSPEGCQTQAMTTVISDTSLPVISITPPGMIDCNNLTQTLNLNLDNQDDSVSWYDAAGNLISNDEDITVSQGGEYTAIVTNAAGCSTQATTTVEEGDNVFPEAFFMYQSDEFSFQFSDESIGSGELLWDFGDGNSSSEMNPSHVYTEPGVYTVCVDVLNPCGNDKYCQEVIAATALALTYSQTNISCFGANDGSVAIFADGGIGTLRLFLDGTELFDSSISDLGPGNYELRLEDEVGSSTTTMVDIYEPEVISIESQITPTSSSTMEGSITIEISGGTGSYTIEWEDGSTTLVRDNLPQGTYTVTVLDENDCTHEETFNVTGTVAVNDIQGLQSFTVSPNPSSNFIDLYIILESPQTLGIDLLSAIGERITLGEISGQNISQRFDISDLNEGIYVLKLRNGEKVSIKKILVVR